MPARLTYLDVLRGIAAVAVMLSHYEKFFYSPWLAGSGPYKQQPFYGVLWPLYDHGGWAVQLFWILSGIVFLTAYGNVDVTLKKFAVRRFARLYPLHFLTLIFVVILNAACVSLTGNRLLPSNDFHNFLRQIVMSSGWGVNPTYTFNFPIWSVSVELVSYAAFFVYLRYSNRSAKLAAIIFILASVAALVVNSLLITCVALFFMGVTMAKVNSHISLSASSLALVSALPISVCVAYSPWSRHLIIVMTYIMIPAILLSILALDLHMPPVPSKFYWIGECTYAVYLIHIPVLYGAYLAMTAVGYQPAVLAASCWTLLIYISFVILSSVFIYSKFEKPVEKKLRRALEGRRR